jgi:hypothetical protein
MSITGLVAGGKVAGASNGAASIANPCRCKGLSQYLFGWPWKVYDSLAPPVRAYPLVVPTGVNPAAA